MKKVKYSKEVNIAAPKKKILSKEVIWSLLIAIIMVSSIIGFMYSGDGGADFTYKDEFKFIRTNNNLFIYKDPNDNQFTFRYLPYELEEFNITTSIKPPMVYVSFDPNSSNIEMIALMRFELLDDLGKLDIFTKQGITENSSLYDMDIINCDYATPNVPVIEFISSNKTSITEYNNCIILEGKDRADIVRLKERLLYKILGILE